MDHWTLKWGDLLQNNRKYLGEKGAFEFREWIRDAIAQNKRYDRMVREMLAARGSSYDSPEANFYRVTRDPKPTMEKTTQVFLGVRMVCAQCHDHPVRALDAEPVLRDGGVLLRGRPAAGLRSRRRDRLRPAAGLRHEAPEGRPRDDAEVHRGRRRARPPTRPAALAYAEWLTSKDNPFFAKSTANRIWSYFFGRGIIDPVDDIRASNPADQSGAARRAHEGLPRSRFRPAPPDAHHRQLARLPDRASRPMSGTPRTAITSPTPFRAVSAPRS